MKSSEAPQFQQEAELQQLQAQLLAVRVETAATIDDLIHTQARTILGESENAALREDIATRRSQLVQTQIGDIVRKTESR